MSRQILTNPPERVFPTEDNAEGNLVVARGDYIVKSEGVRYMVLQLLGTGTFGQVFRCVTEHGEEVAIKVVKASNRYYQCGMNEVRALKRLKDLQLSEHFVELLDAFIFHQHLCIVLELLGVNMFELSRILKFRGFEYSSLRNILGQILAGLCELTQCGITHCDLKPENILVSDMYRESVKIIDFGSSTSRGMSTVFYAQSRFYRAPEVILGIPYSGLVDVWSFGCIAYELLMGHPLFPGANNREQIHLINDFYPEGLPQFMLDHGKHTQEFFSDEKRGVSHSSAQRVTQAVMAARIKEKYGAAPECEDFVDMLLMALTPSYLERALPRTLLDHPFFTHALQRRPSFPVTLREFSPVPSTPDSVRRSSVADYRKERDLEDSSVMSRDMRKGSLYDVERENSFNQH